MMLIEWDSGLAWKRLQYSMGFSLPLTEEVGCAIASLQVGEYVIVPFTDDSLIPIPFNYQTDNATKKLDYLMISGIFTTGWPLTGIDLQWL